MDGAALFKVQPLSLEGVPTRYGSRTTSRLVDPHVGVCASWGKLTGSPDMNMTNTQ